jgi:glutaminyl-peptide cyclotransferase
MKKYFFFLISAFTITSCGNDKGSGDNDNITNSTVEPPPVINYSIIKVYPHDTSSYTQGLFLNNQKLYEGTGQPAKSKLAVIDINTGKPQQEIKINPNEFGEGIALLNGKIYQLTWQNNIVHVYDAVTLKKINDLPWPYEGWGLTTDGKSLIVSTGSSNLYYANPEDFKIIKQVGVTDNYGPVANLNELEFINGAVFANEYETNYILKIDTATGKVIGKLDCSGLLQKSGMNYNPGMYELQTGNVLNGIAYNAASNSLYITGKYWPALFEIKLSQ